MRALLEGREVSATTEEDFQAEVDRITLEGLQQDLDNYGSRQKMAEDGFGRTDIKELLEPVRAAIETALATLRQRIANGMN